MGLLSKKKKKKYNRVFNDILSSDVVLIYGEKRVQKFNKIKRFNRLSNLYWYNFYSTKNY